MSKGKVYLTGGGCGDAGLLTIKAFEVLRSCDVVVYDSLVSEELLQWTRLDCEKIYVGKRYGSHAREQDEINALLVEKAGEGRTVVRLKGGDPYVFGRGGEEFLALKAAGILCEEIPGITSAIAAPAAAGIPVTHRGLSTAVTIVTGTVAEGDIGLYLDFDTLVRLEGTLVILMGMHHLKEIAEGLLTAGKEPDTPCAIVMEGTTDRQRCLRTSLGRLYEEAKGQGFTSPAVIVVGAVAELELTGTGIEESSDPVDSRLSGLEGDTQRRPSLRLAGVTVGVTGTPHFAKKLAAALEREGARVEDMSFLKILQAELPLPDLRAFRWFVFTSPNGVRVFLDKVRQERQDLRTLSGKKIAVIGPGTAAVLEESGIYADYMPAIYDAAHLAEGLTEKILAEAPESVSPGYQVEENVQTEERAPQGSMTAVFLRAERGSESLPQVFMEKGISFVDYPLYRLEVCEEKRDEMLEKRPDYIVFGSAMGVRTYFEGLKQRGAESEFTADLPGEDCCKDGRGETADTRIQDKKRTAEFAGRYVCIGEQCGEELRKYTDRNFLTAREVGVEALVECVCRDVLEA